MGWAKYAEDIRIQKEEKIDWREINGRAFSENPNAKPRSDHWDHDYSQHYAVYFYAQDWKKMKPD